LNCGAIPRELIGSELFGYVEGAFTGARKGGNPGKFELANGGTIFLDEIGDMPFEQQAVLLRVIQEKSLSRIGATQVIPVDVRIICATNKDLHSEISREKFRKDLYYRLNVISIHIPPLRERKGDIVVLFNQFLKNVYNYWSEDSNCLNQTLLEKLQAYDWPGNVRELQNVAERMLNTASGSRLGIEHLPAEMFAMPVRREVLPEKKTPLEVEGTTTIREMRDQNRQFLLEEERRQMI
jgi:transcriptional regulator with PAS, ATPase and Fis domain